MTLAPPTICRRCKRERRIKNKLRHLCASCCSNMPKAELHCWAPVLPPLEVPALPSDNRRASVNTRREAARAAWRRGYSQLAIARTFGLSGNAIWRYINEETMQ